MTFSSLNVKLGCQNMSYRMSHTLVSFTRPSLVPRFPKFIQIKPMDMAIKHTHYLKYKELKSNLNSIKIFIGSKINVNREISVSVISALLRIDRLNLYACHFDSLIF